VAQAFLKVNGNFSRAQRASNVGASRDGPIAGIAATTAATLPQRAGPALESP
jgi:hypothetical protein